MYLESGFDGPAGEKCRSSPDGLTLEIELGAVGDIHPLQMTGLILDRQRAFLGVYLRHVPFRALPYGLELVTDPQPRCDQASTGLEARLDAQIAPRGQRRSCREVGH